MIVSCELSSQEYYNKLFEFDGLISQLAHNCDVKDGKLFITGSSKLPPQLAQGIFYAEFSDGLEPSYHRHLEKENCLLTMSLTNGNVFLDDEFVSAFLLGNKYFIYKIQNGLHVVIDSIENGFDANLFPIIKELKKDKDSFIVTGSNSEVVDEIQYHHPFIYNLLFPSDKIQFFEFEPFTFTEEIFPYTDSTYVLFKTFFNPVQNLNNNWSMLNIVHEVNADNEILNSWVSEKEDFLGQIESVIHSEEENAFYVAGVQVKSNEQNTNTITRSSLYKFSFENGIEWQVNPTGLDWDNWGASRDVINEIIFSNDGNSIVVAGADLYNENDTTFSDGIIAKYNFNGDEIWSHRYNVLSGGHMLNDISSYDGNGYVAVGTMNWIYNNPDSVFISRTWVLKINNDGEFDTVSSSIISPLNSKNILFDINPNPVTDVLGIRTNVIGRFSIYDNKSSIVKTINLKNLNSRINLSALQSGLYFYLFSTLDGRVLSGKFYKN